MLTVLLALHIAAPKSQTPFAVARSGTGSTTHAPMRSTMHRFLINRKLVVRIFSWHILLETKQIYFKSHLQNSQISGSQLLVMRAQVLLKNIKFNFIIILDIASNWCIESLKRCSMFYIAYCSANDWAKCTWKNQFTASVNGECFTQMMDGWCWKDLILNPRTYKSWSYCCTIIISKYIFVHVH